MARPPEFDRAAAVRAARGVFWARGFPGTSMKALEAATGLQPGSLYAAFGSKEGLFREALADYVQAVVAAAVRPGVAPREQIRRWFAAMVDAAVDDGGRGCLILHGAAELAHHDAESRAAVQEELGRLVGFFAACVAAARPELGAEAVADRAGLLVAALAGISAWSRA
ncbi:MAG: helix-turn-helix domain-containing protein, partial [Myxococcota bacterium]